MFKALLLSAVTLVCASQVLGTVGGYQSYSYLSSQDFQNVLAFVYASNPSLSSYQPTTVQRQLVNGFNYRINLQNTAGCTAQVTVYATLRGTYSISAFSQPPCPNSDLTVTPAVVVLPPPLPTPIIPKYGGYNVQSNPSGAIFESALAQALAQNGQFYRSDLVLTESQVVAGFNYRFTFRNADGSLKQVVIYVPIGGLPTPAPTPTPAPVLAQPPTAGGWTELTDSSSYLDALNAIIKFSPQTKAYSVVGVESQVVAGRNYRVGLQNNSANSIKYALFKVFISLSGSASVTQLAWIDVGNYPVQTLIQYSSDSLQQHPELSGFSLTSIENIWPSEGVAEVYSDGSKQYRVFIYVNKGQLLNLIY
jgi:hypothetical protein